MSYDARPQRMGAWPRRSRFVAEGDCDPIRDQNWARTKSKAVKKYGFMAAQIKMRGNSICGPDHQLDRVAASQECQKLNRTWQEQGDLRDRENEREMRMKQWFQGQLRGCPYSKNGCCDEAQQHTHRRKPWDKGLLG
ncbi:hypothetical protein BGW80DRAFT_1506001 [Lactifluus volemus]|nr:hypothetical protein BGW80DRAFT_1506001 [Lactifluus volemus]